MTDRGGWFCKKLNMKDFPYTMDSTGGALGQVLCRLAKHVDETEYDQNVPSLVVDVATALDYLAVADQQTHSSEEFFDINRKLHKSMVKEIGEIRRIATMLEEGLLFEEAALREAGF